MCYYLNVQFQGQRVKMGQLRTLIVFLIKNVFFHIIVIFTECNSWMQLGFLMYKIGPRVSNLNMEIDGFEWCFLRFLQHLYWNSWILLYDRAQPHFHLVESCSASRICIMNDLLEKMPFSNPLHHWTGLYYAHYRGSWKCIILCLICKFLARNMASLEQMPVKILHNPQARSYWSNGGSYCLLGKVRETLTLKETNIKTYVMEGWNTVGETSVFSWTIEIWPVLCVTNKVSEITKVRIFAWLWILVC